MVCNFQKNKSKCKENRQTCNRYVDRSSRQLYNCNDYRSKEGSALGKNIVDAKIFSRILRRNNFGIIRPRQRLNRSLKASHSKCQNRKVHQRPQCQRIEADDKIACDADQNQGYRIFFPRQFCKKQRSSKSDNLRGKQENNLSDRIQVQIGSDVDAVVNDSSDPINIEKESNQKEKYFPVRNCDFFQGSEYFSKCLTDGNRSHFHVILLPILLQQRQRHHQPPESRHAKANHLRDKIRQHPDHIRPQNVSNQCYKKRNAGSQVSPRIAIGGYLIHTFLRCHIIQHGIVNRQRCIIADSCHNINDQKQHPARCNAIQHTSCNAQACRCGKKDLFLILTIRQHTADRTDQCHHHRNN